MNGVEFLPGCIAEVKDFTIKNAGQNLIFSIQTHIACEGCQFNKVVRTASTTAEKGREKLKKR